MLRSMEPYRDKGGIVEVSWEIDPVLTIRWKESGGPPVKQPKERGFGTRLLGGIFVGGSVKFDFKPEGLEVVMHLPGDASP